MKKILMVILLVFSSILSVISLYPMGNIVYATDIIDVDVKEYCLVDANTGTILVEKNSEERREVASMVKLMTSLLVMEKIENGEWSLEDELFVSDYAASMEGSQAFLDAGQSYKIDDLLKSVIVASANDSCVVLAENYAGSETKFVDLMNQKAKVLGMDNTLYGNCTGLPAFNQYSTAQDIAKLLNIVSKYNLYHQYSTIWMDKLVHKNGRETELVNTNRLVKYYPGCDCGKTGFTDEAGYCLSASAKRNDMRLISVVMGAKNTTDRFAASSSLLNYGFSNFKNSKVVDATNHISTGKKLKGSKEVIECCSKNDLYVLQKCGEALDDLNIETEFNEINKNLQKGDVIGHIKVLRNGDVLCESDLIVDRNYNIPTFIEITQTIFENWAI